MLASPGYECAFAAAQLAALEWSSECVCCGARAVCGLRLSERATGVLSGHEAVLDDAALGRGPGYCAEHGRADDPVARAVVVARTPARATAQFSLYAAYRDFLDRNRDRVDVEVRSGAVTDPPAA